MNEQVTDITADAIALQERDEFRAQGWLKVIAPAKVNLHLAIGARRPDGRHDADTIMHAINLHDVAYMRLVTPEHGEDLPLVRMVACGDVPVPPLESKDNIATKAITALAEAVGATPNVEMRIEKNIPAQGGLGGGSSNAAAALLGAAHLWGVPKDEPAIERIARQLGSDVAFFLHGGCSRYRGTGDVYVNDLAPSKRSVALVKPAGGVSTGEAYRTFDEEPIAIPADVAARAQLAQTADEVELFNNLAPASEKLMPALGDVRTWLLEQKGVMDALLCGSGATSFAICDDFSTACTVVAEARKLGYWARATSFGSIRVMLVS